MTAWLAAALGLVPPMLFALVAAGRGPAAGRLVGAQLACTVAVLLTALFAVLDDQSSSFDLALALALLSLPSTLLFALSTERWL